jgi:cytochrome c biogenesis protein CcmG/thiol:disulfide interchange protein DsbE
MMTAKWMIAAVGAVGLAAMTMPVMSCGAGGGQASTTAQQVSDGGTCSADAEPANLDFTLTDMDGKKVNLADYKGRPVLINFWATWCPPCKQEIPAFIDLQDKYRDQGFVVLGVSTDDPADALKQFAAEYKMNYPVLQGTEELMNEYGPIWAIPVSIFVKRDGTICKKHMGPATKEDFERDIKALL